jgi:hypothetical protein
VGADALSLLDVWQDCWSDCWQDCWGAGAAIPIADLRPALAAYLLAGSSVAAKVGGSRIYPVILPQGERNPSIVYNRITAQGDHHMTGPSGLAMVRMQIDAWAAKQDDADALARAIKARIDGFRGVMGDGVQDVTPVTVQGVFFDSARDDYHADAEMFRVSQDFRVWYAER